MASSGSILGNPVLRREDPDILTGGTEYLDDLDIEGLLHVAFVRSTIAHARIESIDTDDAKAMPGVVAVYTNGDLDLRRPPRLRDAAADDEPAAARARQGPLRRRHRRDDRRGVEGAGDGRGRDRHRRLRPAPVGRRHGGRARRRRAR